MTYRETITATMTELSLRPEVVFIGYNILFDGHVYGTMSGVGKDSCVEMPVAENLMTGVAGGMALEGYKPVVIFERHNFIWIAMDQLVNHIDKMKVLSEGQFSMPVIIRTIIGANKPLDPGPQHVGNYIDVFKKVFTDIAVIDVKTKSDIDQYLQHSDTPRLFVEHRDIYDTEV